MKSALLGVICAMSVVACGLSPNEREEDADVDDGPPSSVARAAEPFTVTLIPLPILPRIDSRSPVIQVATVTNNLTRPLTVTYELTGDFADGGTCTDLAPHGTCTLAGEVDTSTLGVRRGKLVAHGGGFRTKERLRVTVQPFVAGFVVAGQGSVTLSPAPTPGCGFGFGGCYPEGTQVTATAVPGPGFAFTGWDHSQCGSAPTCTVTAGLEAIQLGASFAPLQVPLAIEITGGLGEVVVTDSGHGGGVCTASCTLTVSGGPLTAVLTTPGYILGLDGVPMRLQGALHQDYPSGTSTIAAEFGGDPGEQELLADDAEFGPGNELALRVGGTITVYDAAMAPQWSAPGDKMAFTPTGELYIQDGAAHTTKYASNGSILLAADTALGFVTPSGGMLVPGPTSDQFSILDASLAVVATRTIRGEFGGVHGGCLGQNDHEIWASGHLPDHGTSTFDIFNLAGDLVFDADRDWADCRTHPTYHGGLVFATFNSEQVGVDVEGSTSTFSVEDSQVITTNDAYDAAVDGSDHLYWSYAPSDFGNGPTISLLRKYAPPSQTPVWTVARFPDHDGNGGIEPSKVAAAPDGRVAWVVRWFHPLHSPTRAVLIFPADFAGSP
jgi:hypothetical protein